MIDSSPTHFPTRRRSTARNRRATSRAREGGRARGVGSRGASASEARGSAREVVALTALANPIAASEILWGGAAGAGRTFGLRRWHLITGLSVLAFEATLSRGKVVSPALFAYPIPSSETSRARTAGVRTRLARDGREPIATLAIPAPFRSFTFETTLARRKVVRATTRARPIPRSAHARALRGRAHRNRRGRFRRTGRRRTQPQPREREREIRRVCRRRHVCDRFKIERQRSHAE